MKSIKKRFDNAEKENPRWSSYMCFAEAIKKQNLNDRALRHWFDKLVDKNDYARGEKEDILLFLTELTKSDRIPKRG